VKLPADNPSAGFAAALNRRNALRLMTLGVTGATGAILNGTWIEPGNLSITRQNVICKKLPSGLDGLRIGLLADFHYRPEQDEALLEQVVQAVNGENLDCIALTGDFISKDPRVLPPLLTRLEKMKAAHGIFAVMGNHDGWNSQGASVRKQFEKVGISFLINQHCLLSIRGESLAVAGTDFVWLGQPDPARTLRGIATDTPVVALVHEPDYFDVMAAQRDILLQLSGHTHGGQCRVPLLDYSPVKVKFGVKYNYGSFSRNGSNLFVTRGVGTTGPRVRFACPPELAILTLRPPGFV
jgi:hypothetical protein